MEKVPNSHGVGLGDLDSSMLECRLTENKPQLDDPGQHALTNANQNRNGQDTGHLNTTARDSGASPDTDEVSSGPNTSLEMVSILSRRAIASHERYKQFNQAQDIISTIEAYGQALSLTPSEHPERATRLNNLGSAYQSRFKHLGNPEDLEMAIDLKHQAVSLTSDEHPDKPTWLNNLGCSFHSQFEHSGHAEDLDTAINLKLQAVSLTPDEHPDKPMWLNNLGYSYQIRFKRLGDAADLETAFWYRSQAVLLTPDTHPNKPSWLNNLGVSYQSRFERAGDTKDLEMAIKSKLQAAKLVPDTHPKKPIWLNNLGYTYDSLYERSNDSSHVDLAIEYRKQSVLLTPQGHQSMSVRLKDLSLSYESRFEGLGHVPDLEQAISYMEQSLSLLSEGNSTKPARLHNLSRYYERMYRRLGRLENLDMAINTSIEAVSLTPDGHSSRPMRLNTLGVAQYHRFIRLKDPLDLNMAIENFNQAVSLTSQSDPGVCARLNSLGSAYQTRFDTLGNTTDLKLAIEFKSKAVSLAPDQNPDRPTWLNNLAGSYRSRFEVLDNQDDLELAIDYGSQAVALTPDKDPSKATRLNNLGFSYQSRFERLRLVKDINMAIEYRSQAVSITPDDDSYKARWYNNISYSYLNRFELTKESTDIEAAIEYSKRAAQTFNAMPATRFNAARKCASLTRKHSPSSSLEAYRQVMSLVPQVVWIGNSSERRYKSASLITEAVMDSALTAIQLKEYETAVEWLEEGRSIIWNQTWLLRSPIDQLSTVNPPLALDLAQINQELELASLTESDEPDSSLGWSRLEKTSQRHRRLAEEWERLIQQARSLPGMRDFLRPRKTKSILAAAQTGAVVLVVVHEASCHALVLRQNADSVDCLPLKNLTYEKVAVAHKDLISSLQSHGRTSRGVSIWPKGKGVLENVLVMLWLTVAKPVLDFLRYERPASDATNRPHITWCTTGPLSFLPLHAAGDYSKPGCSLFEYVISSFTPTLSALLVSPPDPASASRVLAIGQTYTPGLSDLPGTTAELDQIQTQTRGTQFTRLEDNWATTGAALEAIHSHGWVHFACHASQNTAKPTASAFHLHDGSLTLTRIAQMQLKDADLAFLSACQTATGDKELPEEAVHLAAGMLMAGYKRVIATMWSIDDQDAPLVAERFYAYMLNSEMPSERKAAKALHYAIRCLRDEVGVKEFERWVPYIHIGL